MSFNQKQASFPKKIQQCLTFVAKHTDLDTIGIRLQKIMKHYGIKQVTLSQRLGVTKGYISMLVNEKEPLTINLVYAILKSFPLLNSFWVLTGEGEMFLGDNVIAAQGKLDPQVMESDVRYEAMRGGILESLLARVSVMEDRLEELEAELRALREGCGGKE